MTWNLYKKEEFLKPLCFSNGKTQEDVVKEVLQAVEEGNKIIFIHGVCGTGKSAIALNIARNIGKASVVVPVKNLQMQYKRDYEGEKYLLKDNKEKLKISVITGRKNHKCKFLEDNKNAIPKVVREVNSKLHDIFAGKKEALKETIANDISADNKNIPCKIEIKEKNLQRLKQYLRENKDVNEKSFNQISDIKRVSVASACPFWCPVLPSQYEFGGKSFQSAKKKKYMGLKDTEFTFYQRRFGCPYYEQFNSYIDSDVIVFNSLKYKLESALNRKPRTEVEIVDECDEFLDSFSNQRNINIERLQNALIHIFSKSEDAEDILYEMREIVKQIKRDPRIGNATSSEEIIPLKQTGLYDFLKILLKHPDLLYDVDEENYIFDVEETARMFEGFFEDTYVTFSKKDEQTIASLVTTNLAKRFQDMVDKNKIIVMMSGTLHSNEVLEEIFGLKKFKIIEAEVEQQGQINVVETGKEMDCKYSNFSSGKHSREEYLKALDECIEISKRPTLVHVNSFLDLPKKEEIEEFDLKNLEDREKLRQRQNEDSEGKLVDDFKKGESDILFSTRAARGIDFPGDECHSIIFTKYPNPNVQDAFWKILNRTKPMHYWNFYRDKARRELLQKIYRGVRFGEDKVDVLSPDIRVLNAFREEK